MMNLALTTAQTIFCNAECKALSPFWANAWKLNSLVIDDTPEVFYLSLACRQLPTCVHELSS